MHVRTGKGGGRKCWLYMTASVISKAHRRLQINTADGVFVSTLTLRALHSDTEHKGLHRDWILHFRRYTSMKSQWCLICKMYTNLHNKFAFCTLLLTHCFPLAMQFHKHLDGDSLCRAAGFLTLCFDFISVTKNLNTLDSL